MLNGQRVQARVFTLALGTIPSPISNGFMRRLFFMATIIISKKYKMSPNCFQSSKLYQFSLNPCQFQFLIIPFYFFLLYNYYIIYIYFLSIYLYIYIYIFTSICIIHLILYVIIFYYFI